jgi:cell division protein ZapE
MEGGAGASPACSNTNHGQRGMLPWGHTVKHGLGHVSVPGRPMPVFLLGT